MVGQSALDTFVDMTDELLGDIIEEVIEDYYEDKINIEDEYEDVLNYIVRRLVKKAGKKNKGERYLKILERLRNKTPVAKLVISYLISEYIRERDFGSLETHSGEEYI